MPRQQFAISGEINQLMGDMSRMMASSMNQLSGLKSVMSGVWKYVKQQTSHDK